MCPQAFDPVLCQKNLAAVLSDLHNWETYQDSQVKGNSEVKTVIAINIKSVLKRECGMESFSKLPKDEGQDLSGKMKTQG